MCRLCLILPELFHVSGPAGNLLEDLYVKPHLRGRGVGIALLVRVARIATERGCGMVEWGVLDWNEPSIYFYKNLGAVPMDEWTKFRLTGEALEKLADRAADLGGQHRNH
jgi:GNAT superfamily N-acetyltransferase